MGCDVYEALRSKWKSLITGVCERLGENYTNIDEAIRNAYSAMVEHRMSCEVCKDEDIALGLMKELR
jgi:hypothetical protein